jgi:hypothetical protein
MERMKMPNVRRTAQEKIALLQEKIREVERMANRSKEQKTVDGAIRALKRARKVIADEMILDAVDAAIDGLTRARG